MWRKLLDKHRSHLDMSSLQLDGAHTPAKRGGEAVGYQGRKKSQTSNLLILTDSRGISIACSEPIAGNHHDSFRLNQAFLKMLSQIHDSHIATEGLFLNADSGFDSINFRKLC